MLKVVKKRKINSHSHTSSDAFHLISGAHCFLQVHLGVLFVHTDVLVKIGERVLLLWSELVKFGLILCLADLGGFTLVHP